MFGDLYASFLIIILHHPDCCWVMYCYSTFLFHYYYYYYYITPTCGVMYCYSTFLFHYYSSYYITPTLLFYVSFWLFLRHPERSQVTYCYSTFLFHYYYVAPNAVGWRIAILRFFFTIIILPHIFVRSISWRCPDQTLWNLVGISYAMWSCAGKGLFFQNGCRCHGNGQNA
jgi:hypothetical protein